MKTFTYPLRVYYQDTDAGGVVYHANYLGFAERARTEALREMGAPHEQMVRQFGVMFMVRRVIIDYQRPARLDDMLRVETAMRGLSGARVDLVQSIWRDSDSLAVLEVALGCARVADGRAARIPPSFAEIMRLRGEIRVGSDS